MNMTMIKLQLKLLALKAIPEIERRALAWLAENKDQVFGNKRAAALAYMKEQYAKSTAHVPGLNATDIDDRWFTEQAEHYLDWAWAQLGDVVNGVVREPVNNDPTLPKGGLQ
ncbi:hypothetical protein D3875_02605 [Deinococcus cavernae]|uniref:Uncharacterized protein n=2 Tax=Deinococcus cavernae TaxID=2320857 RepID=A0A418VFK7_9DEIO|nr:hypothetical protein D3875_02605 [Deinococcus cavernae]